MLQPLVGGVGVGLGAGAVGVVRLVEVTYWVETNPERPPQFTGSQPLLAVPRTPMLRPSPTTMMTAPLVEALDRQRTPPPPVLTTLTQDHPEPLVVPPPLVEPLLARR
jgi:hypothetical protein